MKRAEQALLKGFLSHPAPAMLKMLHIFRRLALDYPGQPREKNGRFSEGKMLTNAAGQTIIEVEKVDVYGPPNGITQKVNAKGGIDRNYYDSGGRQSKQISNNGHGHKKEEAMGLHGEHAHDYAWDEDGKPYHLDARELTDTERSENNDFLKTD